MKQRNYDHENNDGDKRREPRSEYCYQEHARMWERISGMETDARGLIEKFMTVETALVRYDKQWFDLTMRFETMNTQTAQRELKLAETMTQMRMGIDALNDKIKLLQKLPGLILGAIVSLSVAAGALWTVGKYFIKANLP